MKFAVFPLLIVVSLGLVAGCGEPELVSTLGDSGGDAGIDGTSQDTTSDTPQSDGDSGPVDECIQTTPTQAANFARDYAQAMCDRAFACDNNPEMAALFSFGGWEDAEDCVSYVQAGVITPGQAEQAATEGSLALDSCNSAPCLSAIPNIDCLALHRAFSQSPVDHPVDECPNAYRGMVEEGGECTIGAQCSGSSVCNRTDSTASCTGTCTDAGQASAQCGEIVCRFDQYCQTENDICVAKKANGESCINDFECMIDSECESGTCVADQTGLDVGADCNYTTMTCRAGLACLDGTCGELKSEGESCPLIACAGDFYCSASSETCEPFKTAGETCSTPQECKSLNCGAGECAPFDALCP